jgi:hypothetical protein
MYTLAVLFLFLVFTVTPAVAQLTEGFETGLPTSAISTPTDYTLSSGVWTIMKGLRNTTKHGGIYALRLNSGASGGASYATAPALATVSTVSFWARGSGASTMTLQKSVNGGTYTTVASQKITSSYASYTITVNETGGNVRIRFQNSTSQTHYIDDVVISGGTALPALSVNPTSSAYGNVVINATSQKTYTLSGSALSPASGNITITAPSGYQVSTASGSGFASSITIAYTGGALPARTIYVNFTPTAVQSYNGNITNAGGGATTVNEAVTGTGIAASSPTLTVSPTSLAYGNVVINTTSQKTYTLSGSALSPASGNITITAPTGYQVSTASGSGFASSITIAYTSGALSARTIYVNFTPTAVQSYNGNITNAGGGATTVNVAVSGTGVASLPATITVSPTSLSFGNIVINTTSAEQTYTLSAANLTPASGNITITAPTAFQVSATSGSGFATSITIAYTSGTLSARSIYARFTPTAVQSYSGNITNAGGGATTQNVAVSGSGVSTPPAGTYYVSPSGNDANSGSISAPLKNLQVAVNKMVPGDVVYVRGGTYYPDYKQDGAKTTIRLTASGTAANKMCIYNYPGETPILNFRDQPKAVSVRGVQLNGNYWHIKGITFTEAGDNGMKLEGNHNIIEKCTFSYNDDGGLQLGFGHVFADSHPGISSNDGSYCAYNDIIDCDSYLNYDTDNRGSDADGFACKMHNGKSNRYIRCRAWDNSDDAWDLFETDYPVYIIECWAWGSGRASNFNVVGGSFQGNGNGIKLGGNGTGGSSKGKHEVWNCFAFNNNKTTSVKGFDQNSHGGGVKLVNCVAFGNGYDYMFETASGVREFYNNIAFGRIELASGTTQGNNAIITNPDQGWTNNVCSTFTTADFNSLAEAEAKKPRGADGSLPTSFGRLVASSVLINKGTVVSNTNSELSGLGLPRAYTGSAPDLGAYEYGLAKGVGPVADVNVMREYQLRQNYPNPFNPTTMIAFSLAEDSRVSLKVYDMLGREVATLVNGFWTAGDHQVPFDASRLSSGLYIYRLQTGNMTLVKKMTLMK